MHVHIKHEIEYGCAGFNWQSMEVHNLLKEVGCEIGGSLDMDCTGEWEIEEEAFRKAVESVRQMPDDKVAGFFGADYNDTGDNAELKKRITDLLQNFADTGDHRGGYYHFSWF